MNEFIPSQDRKMEQWVEMITDQDLKRILACLGNDCLELQIVELWEEKFERARIISQDEAPADLITIHSMIKCREEGNRQGELEKMGDLSLVFPHEANIDEGKISIMAPLGIALMGGRLGQPISWCCRNGRTRSLVVDSISYQPEASGHWHL